MSILIKRLRFYARNVMGRTLNKRSLLEKSQDYSPDKQNLGIFQSQSSNAQNVDMSTQTSSPKRFNLLTDTHSGLHNYD
jgi:hypothetical protein